MTALDFSSDAGLVAMVLLMLNILLGLILSARYNTLRCWSYRRFPVFDLHNWTAYIALSLVFLHPIILLFSKDASFRVLDILWPVHSPKQTSYNCLGAVAFYCVIVVVVTSYFRSRLGSRLWKKLHYVSYLAAGFLFVHGILIDPNLKNAPPDLLDGEKVLIEICALVIAATSVWRIRYRRRKRAVGPSVRKMDYEAV